jgi:hypothetical protein
MRNLIGALAAILVLMLAGDLHATLAGTAGAASPATTFSPFVSCLGWGGQIEVAHSKDIVGAGIVAGGPFACAETESSSLFPYWPVVLWQNATRARTPA